MIDLKQRLIVDYSSLKSVAKILTSVQSELILVFFTLAILFEFFGEWNFFKVIKRIVICFIILVAFDSLFRSSIDMSFGISQTLLDNCKNTEFCSHYLNMKKGASSDSTLWTETTNMVKNFSSFWLHSLVSIIFKLAFIFTIQIYSLVYAITSISYPLICSIGILPSPGEKAYISLFQTLLWLFISPIILSVVIVLLASVTEVGMGPNGEVGLEGILHLMVISLFSLGSLFLSWLLCKGEGVASFGAKMAQMGTSVLSMAGVGGMMSMGKGLGGATRELGGMAAGYSKNKLKDHVSNIVSESVKNKGIEVGASEIAHSKNGLMNSPLVPKDSEAYKSLSAGEKVFHSIDSMINSKENSLAKKGMVRDLKKMNQTDSQVAKIGPSNYKNNARKGLSPNHFQKNQPANFKTPRSISSGYRPSPKSSANPSAMDNMNGSSDQSRGTNLSRTNESQFKKMKKSTPSSGANRFNPRKVKNPKANDHSMR